MCNLLSNFFHQTKPCDLFSNVAALTAVDIENLDQNTLYEITYQAVGRGGERSEESTVIRSRTRKSHFDFVG